MLLPPKSNEGGKKGVKTTTETKFYSIVSWSPFDLITQCQKSAKFSVIYNGQ